MRKTLLLVFIHGFKGGDDTFEKFPEHLRVLVSDLLPRIDVLSVVYPKFETRGELHDSVAKFKEWLQNKVIDLEVAAGTPSPTIDPSVRVALIGHSMGGIVAAETLLSIARDEPVPSSTRPSTNRTTSSTATNSTSNNTATSPTSPNLSVPPTTRATSAPPPQHPPSPDPSTPSSPSSPSSLLFPFIQAILAFDTPYLGIHPGVVAHGAEAHYNTASAAYSAYNQASKFFGTGRAGSAGPTFDAAKALPAAGTKGNATAAGGGGGWGKYAMFAAGAGALAAGAAGAYYGRERISGGWKWVGEHLSFVGCLARGAELTGRVEDVVRVSERHGIGFVDFYTVLGKKGGKVGSVVGEERTFCVVPAKDAGRDDGRGSGGESPAKKRKVIKEKGRRKGMWIEAVNTKSGDEITAHRAMFTPADNPGYYKMSEQARNLLVGWVDKEWYEGSGEGEEQEEGGEEREVEV
ncbi:Hypothetical protein D9617_14g075630 [Elsinoe fawcettii]|nr:Hypothetical protein D9617_14g075630 [Elsinoe fawcettii]